jgi:hypothetical protein
MKLAVLLLALTLAGCAGSSMQACQKAPAPPGSSPATCAGVCERKRAMGCPSGAPTPAGVSCEVVCQTAQSAGLMLNLACRARATTCPALEACGVLP